MFDWVKNLLGLCKKKQGKRTKICLSKSSQRWKLKDKKFIRDNWHTMTDAQLAEHLGRSKKAIATMRQKMRLFSNSKPISKPKHDFIPPIFRERWTPEQDKMLFDNNLSDQCIASALNRTVDAVRRRRRRINPNSYKLVNQVKSMTQ